MTDDDVTIYQNVTKKMLKTTGKRSTKQSNQLLNNYLTMVGHKVAEQAESLAEHADRRTIQEKDVRKAIENTEMSDPA